MRQTQVFSGSSHPELVESICERLGLNPAQAELGKFSNGETKVNLHTSIRDQDVFVVQSGSNKINDDLMELLIMISACRSGSARQITAVMPYFPYSRQSKKKSHRGAITARMVANLLHQAGTNHVITVDLHASQMQGFFQCPVDNLVAEPLLAQWIRANIRDWKRAVVVSKNPGGTKRVTSLADALKLNFGIVMTDRRRPGSGHASMMASMILDQHANQTNGVNGDHEDYHPQAETFSSQPNGYHTMDGASSERSPTTHHPQRPSTPRRRTATNNHDLPQSPLRNVHSQPPEMTGLSRVQTAPSTTRNELDGSVDDDDDDDAEDEDPRSRDVVTGRLIQGHIVDDEDETPSPSLAGRDNFHHSFADDDMTHEHMLSSAFSTTSLSSMRNSTLMNGITGLGGSGDAHASSDDEEDNLVNPDMESTVTLVGNVRDRPVFILDDMIDKSASWIAAAETVVKRGGAEKVFCFATHGLFGGDALEEMEECDCIDRIIVTNSFPIPKEKMTTRNSKLQVLDISKLLAEAIRRNHNGEAIGQLFRTDLYD